LQGSAAWKHATSSKILWFSHEADYRIIPSESQLDSFYPQFEGPSQLQCVDDQINRFTCQKLRRTSDDGRKYNFVQRSPFLGAPAWKDIRSEKLLWFDAEWRISPSEQDFRRIYPGFKPEQVSCLRFSSFLQEAEVNSSQTALAAGVTSAEDARPDALEPSASAAVAWNSLVEAPRSSSLAEVFHSLDLEDWSGDSLLEQTVGQDQTECRRLLDRLAGVGEQDGVQLAENAEDPLFPPTSSSIAAPDDVCTDVDGRPTSCKEYSWGRIPDTLARYAEIAKCVAAKRDGSKCSLKNMCRTSVKLDWLPQALRGDGGDTALSFRDERRLCETELPEGSFKLWAAREEARSTVARHARGGMQPLLKSRPRAPGGRTRRDFDSWY